MSPEPSCLPMAQGTAETLLAKITAAFAIPDGASIKRLETAKMLETAHDCLIAQERLATLGRLAAELAHELKQPLTILRARLDLIAQQFKARPSEQDQWLSHHLAALQEATAWACRITLALSAASAPSRPVFQLMAISPLLEHVRELINPHARAQQVTVAIEQEPGLGVRGDPSQLLAVLLNLATNAIEAMPTGGALSFRARKDSGTVVLDVADTGPGIPAEIKDRIWEPFFTTKAEGTGLGLPIVRQLIETHGGAISLLNHPGNGTTVQIRLPAALTPSPSHKG